VLVPNQIISNNHQRHNLRGQKCFCLFKEGVISRAVVNGLFVAASFYKTAYLFFYHASKTGSRQESALHGMFGPWNIYVAAFTAAVRGMTPSLLVGIDFFFTSRRLLLDKDDETK